MNSYIGKNIILKVKDIWHGKENERWVYSNDPSFKNLNEFIFWVLNHQNSLNGILQVTTDEIIHDGDILRGFLHRHPKMEKDANLPPDHVIVDIKDWREARLYKPTLLEFK